ncbi:MAG: hypothetical protein N2484_14730 [Clostridia bacterium]|nr:hypothetical protein [Clostridia bacterium]
MKKATMIFVLLSVILMGICFAHGEGLKGQSTDSGAEVKYIVAPKGDYFEVQAEISNLHRDKIKVVFPDSCAGVDRLSDRISGFRALTQEGKEIASEHSGNVYLLNADRQPNIILKYELHPNAIKHDFHLVTLASTYLHIPGDNFAVELYDEQDQRLDENDAFKVKFSSLPNGWEPITTYPLSNDGFIMVEDYHEALIHAGEYEKHSFEVGGSEFIIAADKALRFDIKPLLGDIMRILQDFYTAFGKVSHSKVLIVINQGKEGNAFSRYSGAQVKTNNIINEFAGFNRNNQGQLKARVLDHFAHECFHLWMPEEFNIADNWSWFWEGFADYKKYQVLKKLDIISQQDFENTIKYNIYARYYGSKYKDEVSLVAISTEKGDFSEYGRLMYDKGAVVAYLFDKELQKQNRDIDGFLKKLYQEYALPKKPLGNKELLTFMEQELGNDTFTKNYILGTVPLPVETPFFFKYYALASPYLPPIAFPWNVLLPITVLVVLGLLLWLTIKGIIFIFRLKRKGSKQTA